MKKLLSIILACALALGLCALSGCGSDTSQQTQGELLEYEPSEDASISVAALMEPSGLDLNGATFMGTFTVGWFFYDTLLRWNGETKEAEPNVITEWTIVDDLTIDITIRDDVYSHNGFKITTEDLLYSFQRVKDTPAIEQYAEAIDVENCEIIDDTHLRIKLLHPSPDQMLYFTQLCMSATSKEGLEACGGPEANNTFPIACTGPYKMVEWVRGSYMKLERNEDWWGTKPYFKTVQFRFISDNSSRLMALQTGDISAAGQLSNLQAGIINDDPNLNLIQHTGTTYYYMCLNNKRAPFDNVKVRQAINLCIDRNAIIDTVMGGFGTPMDNILPSSSTRYSEPAAGTEWEFNVEKAKQLMKEAGYENGFSMSIMTLSHQDIIDMAEYLTGALAEIGIDVKVDMVEETSSGTKRASGDFDAYIISNAGVHGDTGTLQMYDDRLDYSEGSTCQFHAQDADAFYALMDEFYVTADPQKSKELAASIMDVLREEVPTIQFVTAVEFAATRGVAGMRIVNGNVIMTHLRPSNMKAPAGYEGVDDTMDGTIVLPNTTSPTEPETPETKPAASAADIIDNGDGTFTGPVDFQTGGEPAMVNIEFDDTTFHVWFDWTEFNDSIDLKGTISNGVLTVTEEKASMPGVGSMLIGMIQDQLYAPLASSSAGGIVDNGDGTYTGPVDFQTGGEPAMVNIEFDDTTFHAWFDWTEFNDSIDLKGTISNGVLTVTEEKASMPGVGDMLIGMIQDQLYAPLAAK